MLQDICLIADIVAAHGLRGGVRIRSQSDVPGRFSLLRSALVGKPPSELKTLNVKSAFEGPRQAVLFFDGIETRDAARNLVGSGVYVAAADMSAAPEGRHFIHDIIGCEVRGENVPPGAVKDVLLFPAHDVYVVDCDGREVLVPAVPEIVTSIDTARRIVTISPIPGLFGDEDED